MRIDILSDLHIEFAPFDPPHSVDADVIVLAGDIWLGSRDIVWARQTWPDKEIVFVPGNHEYYRSEIGMVNEQMELSGKELGVHVINRNACIIEGVRFLGATLWTDFGLFGDNERNLAIGKALNALRDFHVIDYGGKTFTPQNSIDFNKADVNWLEESLIREIFNCSTVVVTHHLPSCYSVAEKFKQQLLSDIYSRLASSVGESDLINSRYVVAWCWKNMLLLSLLSM